MNFLAFILRCLLISCDLLVFISSIFHSHFSIIIKINKSVKKQYQFRNDFICLMCITFLKTSFCNSFSFLLVNLRIFIIFSVCSLNESHFFLFLFAVNFLNIILHFKKCLSLLRLDFELKFVTSTTTLLPSLFLKNKKKILFTRGEYLSCYVSNKRGKTFLNSKKRHLF